MSATERSSAPAWCVLHMHGVYCETVNGLPARPIAYRPFCYIQGQVSRRQGIHNSALYFCTCKARQRAQPMAQY